LLKLFSAIPLSEGFELILAADVIRFQADDNYTYLFLKNGTKIVACHTLKEIKEQLQGFLFLSVSIIHG